MNKELHDEVLEYKLGYKYDKCRHVLSKEWLREIVKPVKYRRVAQKKTLTVHQN